MKKITEIQLIAERDMEIGSSCIEVNYYCSHINFLHVQFQDQ